MKILLIGTLLGQGGIQNHLKWLATALAEVNVETLIISLNSTPFSSKGDSSVEYLKKKGIKVSSFPLYQLQHSFLNLSVIFRGLKIKNLIEEFSPDIYFAVGTGWNLSIPLLFVRKKPRCIFHEVMSGKPTNWRDSRWAVRWYFDEVVGQSPIVAQTFAKCFGWKKKLSALPAFPEPLEIIANFPQAVCKKVELGKAKAAIFSRLVPHKQAFWLVQNWQLLQDVLEELHIHGSGPEEQLIRSYVAEHNLCDRIKCFGAYPEGQDYVNLLKSYDLTLLPTVGSEGAPLVLLESIACGVPFVAYAVGGIPDYAEGNPNVLVVPLETESTTNNFVEGVRQMAHKLAFGEINQVQLQKFYLDHYGYEVVKKAWLSYLYG